MGHQEDLGVHQEEQVERWAHDQAGLRVEGNLPGCEPGHVEDGWVRQQAPVLRPWGSPGGLAEEFRRRAGLSSRDVKSCARVFLDGYCSIPLPDLHLNFCRRISYALVAGARPIEPRRRG